MESRLQQASDLFWYSAPHFPYSEAKVNQANTSCARERRASKAVSLVVGGSEVHTEFQRQFAVALRSDSERYPEIL